MIHRETGVGEKRDPYTLFDVPCTRRDGSENKIGRHLDVIILFSYDDGLDDRIFFQGLV